MGKQVSALVAKLRERPRFVSYIVLFLWAAFLYEETVREIVGAWQDSSLYSHGWASLALFLYTLWGIKSSPKDGQLQWLAVPCLVGATMLWWVGTIASIALVQVFAFYALLIGIVWLLWGWHRLFEQKYMLFVLLLAMPIWQGLQLPLRYVSTQVTYAFLKLIDVPVLLEGYHIRVPGGSFLVEPACAGLSFLLAATTLIFVLSAWQRLKPLKVITLLIISSIVAIISNWLRIIVIVLVGNATNMDHIIVHDHLMFGWILFILIYGPVFWLMLQKSPATNVDEPTAPEDSYITKGIVPAFIAGVLLVCVFPLVHSWVSLQYSENEISLEERFKKAKSYRYESAQPINWKPEFFGATEKLFKEIRVKGVRVTLFLVGYAYQTQETELINVNNIFYEKARWKKDRVTAAPTHGAFWLSRGSDTDRVIVYTYVIAGKRSVDWKSSKVSQLEGYFTGKPQAYGLAVHLDNYAVKRFENPEQMAQQILDTVVQDLELLDQ